MTEMQLYDLRVTVERIEGRSVCGLAVGDYFEVTESSRVRIPDGKHFCLFAIQAVLPLLPAKMRRLPERGLARAGQPRLLPGSRGGARDADRAARRALARDGGAHIAREIGLGLLGDQLPADYEAIAREAEAAGIDVVSVFHDLLYQPAIGPLLLMARVTERVRLGPAALNPFTLHPYEIAGQTAMLDLASGGRAYLGLVKGAWLDRLGLDGRAALGGAAGGGRDRAEAPGRRHERRRGRALHARSRHGPRLRARAALGAAADRHLGRAHGRLGGHRRRRAQDRRLGESRARARRRGAGPARPTFASSSAASPSSTRTARGRASARGPRSRRTSTSSPVSTRRSSCGRARSRRSTASRSPGRRRRWPRR